MTKYQRYTEQVEQELNKLHESARALLQEKWRSKEDVRHWLTIYYGQASGMVQAWRLFCCDEVNDADGFRINDYIFNFPKLA